MRERRDSNRHIFFSRVPEDLGRIVADYVGADVSFAPDFIDLSNDSAYFFQQLILNRARVIAECYIFCSRSPEQEEMGALEIEVKKMPAVLWVRFARNNERKEQYTLFQHALSECDLSFQGWPGVPGIADQLKVLMIENDPVNGAQLAINQALEIIPDEKAELFRKYKNIAALQPAIAALRDEKRDIDQTIEDFRLYLVKQKEQMTVAEFNFNLFPFISEAFNLFAQNSGVSKPRLGRVFCGVMTTLHSELPRKLIISLEVGLGVQGRYAFPGYYRSMITKTLASDNFFNDYSAVVKPDAFVMYVNPYVFACFIRRKSSLIREIRVQQRIKLSMALANTDAAAAAGNNVTIDEKEDLNKKYIITLQSGRTIHLRDIIEHHNSRLPCNIPFFPRISENRESSDNKELRPYLASIYCEYDPFIGTVLDQEERLSSEEMREITTLARQRAPNDKSLIIKNLWNNEIDLLHREYQQIDGQFKERERTFLSLPFKIGVLTSLTSVVALPAWTMLAGIIAAAGIATWGAAIIVVGLILCVCAAGFKLGHLVDKSLEKKAKNKNDNIRKMLRENESKVDVAKAQRKQLWLQPTSVPKAEVKSEPAVPASSAAPAVRIISVVSVEVESVEIPQGLEPVQERRSSRPWAGS